MLADERLGWIEATVQSDTIIVSLEEPCASMPSLSLLSSSSRSRPSTEAKRFFYVRGCCGRLPYLLLPYSDFRIFRFPYPDFRIFDFRIFDFRVPTSEGLIFLGLCCLELEDVNYGCSLVFSCLASTITLKL